MSSYRDYQNLRKINNQQREELIKLYKIAYKEALKLSRLVNPNDLESIANMESIHYNHIANQLNTIIKTLDNKTYETLKQLIPREFQAGKILAELNLHKAGTVNIRQTLSTIDQNSMIAILTDTYEDLARANQTMDRYFKMTLREISKEETLKNVITGKGMKVSAKDLQERLENKGMTAFVKKNGAKLKLDDYSSMVIRTQTMKAHNEGNLIMIASNGFDLVQISDHSTSCDLCKQVEGKIYSISGTSDKYPALNSIELISGWVGGPPFHPHCRHVAMPYVEKFYQ